MLLITTLIVLSFNLLIPRNFALASLGENVILEKITQLREQLGLDQLFLIIIKSLDLNLTKNTPITVR